MTGRQRLPDRRKSWTEVITFAAIVYDVSFGFYPEIGGANGKVGEVFISSRAKNGSDLEILTCDAAVLISHLLQRGVKPAEIEHSLLRAGGGPTARATAPASIIGRIVERIGEINREVGA